MKNIFIALLLVAQTGFAQKSIQSDEALKAGLQQSVEFLAADRLEGRRTGTEGEKLASQYISDQFKKAGLSPLSHQNDYLEPFEVNDGRVLLPATSLHIDKASLSLYEDWFPLSLSSDINKSFSYIPTNRKYPVFLFDLKNGLEENKDNPHFDLEEYISNLCREAIKKGTEAIILYNSSSVDDNLKYNPKSKTTALSIPVIYISKDIQEKYFTGKSIPALDLIIKSENQVRTGHNVVGMINNGVKYWVVIGAHYDHLGYGEDHNSLYAGKVPMIHNGADDNASGTASLIELAKWVPTSGLKKYNYLFLAFSGEELGLFGSKYFVDHSNFDLEKVNYMINMDMVGRLNDSTHGLTIGGYGTSPEWGKLILANDPYFKIKMDSSGTGPSDHTSFYLKNIPVLFFFTGIHSDYHKPSDDADKINYNGMVKVVDYIKNILTRTDELDKLSFTKTREVNMASSSFKVTMGIMADYSYSGTGVYIDGVSEGRPAQKAGLQHGDVVVQLGDYKISDMQAYMKALGKFSKGETTRVKVIRDKQEMFFQLTF
ncbi:MAG: hypothetical protein ABS68_08350 [Niastella sp. SCN 39-18]|mgnify:FL=1|nr:M28 family peptidase [Sphingobacteriales bacterium]ODT52578.1 MAG: hypothetical protein ABS68_08350 [Niastella sp. SCN 39-18]OJW11718.1 MAG: hypothetical protein BGO53_12420 [Sphingobacteriales bacterium 39-19]